MAKWVIRKVNADIKKMTSELNISETFATVLANRGVLNKRALTTYINYDEKYLYDFFLMKDAQRAFDIIIKTISQKEKICIYGDYDVDGVTSTVILYKAIKKLGADVEYYIPNREEEGYGLNIYAINEVIQMGVKLILTCDNGIASIEEIRYIKENNIDIIVLDHHEPRFIEMENGDREDIIPIADAIINPKQKECDYPFKALCAGGISFKFIKGLYEYMEIQADLDEYLIFASISTICDIVDLMDENRIIVKKGLEILNKEKNKNKGLFEVLRLNEIHEKEIDENDYGFVIGPCINASGRLESALKAVRLFTSDCENEIKKLAEELFNLNKERKNLTYNAVKEITGILANSDFREDKILVIYSPDLHESIAGIVAGRIKEMYYKPTFVITNAKEGVKGSGRSIPCYNMFEELLKCQDLFLKFGGHKMAAGLSLKEENIDVFRKRINENCNLKNDDMVEIITIDKALRFSEIKFDLIEELNVMKPIGKENKQAIFATKNLSVKNIKIVGKEKNILQFTFLDEFGDKLNAISFNGYERFMSILENNLSNEIIAKILNGIKKDIDLKLDVVYSIVVNEFNGFKNIQLIIKDFRLS